VNVKVQRWRWILSSQKMELMSIVHVSQELVLYLSTKFITCLEYAILEYVFLNFQRKFLIKVKNKGRVTNIPCISIPVGAPPPPPTEQTTQKQKTETKTKTNNQNEKLTKRIKIGNNEDKENDLVNEFFDSLDAATTGIPSQIDKMKNLKKQAKMEEEEEMAAIESLYNIPR